MKKLDFLLTAIFALCAVTALQAQDREWKWAKAYSGTSSGLNGLDEALDRNQIVKSAFDDAGNVYILGTFEEPAKIDGEYINPFNSLSPWGQGQFVAKFDMDGNLVWKKVIKYSINTTQTQHPKWLQVRGNRLYILADIEMQLREGNISSMIYLDTLVYYDSYRYIPEEDCTLPFCNLLYYHANVFITFDLDGNVVSQHFLQWEDRVLDLGDPEAGARRLPMAMGKHKPFYVDSDENIYLFGNVSFWGESPDDPLYTVIDNERRDAFYMPESVPFIAIPLSRWVLYKFNSNFDLLWAKPFVHHTEGIPTFEEFFHDSINPHYYGFQVFGISGDEEGNLYLSGNAWTTAGSEEQCSYPVRFYWDSTHYGTVYDRSTSAYLPFLIKYDRDGNVLWNQQLHHKNNSNILAIGIFLKENIVNEHSVFVAGRCQDLNVHLGDTVFFDAEMQIPQLRTNPGQTQRAFFVQYDKETGEYINHGVIPTQLMSYADNQPAVINNHVLMQAICDFQYMQLSYLCDDGRFMGADTLYGCCDIRTSDVTVHPSGYLFTHFAARGSDATFGDITVSGTSQVSAFFGMLYDPSLLVPYEDDSGIAEHALNACFTLHPNPTTGQLTIDKGQVTVNNVEVLDMMGRQQLSIANCQSSIIQMDVSHLPAGMYFVKINTGEGAVTQKFIKQ